VPLPSVRGVGLTHLKEGIPMSQTDQDKATAAHGKIIARAWRDPAFKAKLLADPHTTLKEAGVAVPEGVTVKVVENTDTHHHLVLPPKPTGELSDVELDKVAGGVCQLQMVAIGTQGC
jgi:hypothetical protein